MAPPVPYGHESFLLGSIYPIFSFLVCMLIYLKTKEIEKLSLNRGVKYFRRAFLFLGLSFPIMFLLMSARVFIGENSEAIGVDPGFRETGIPLGIIMSRYFLLVCVFYLLYSLLWKNFDNRKNWIYIFMEPLIFIVSFVIIGIDLLIGHVFSTLILIIVLSFIAVLSYLKYNRSSKKQKLPWYPISLFLFSLIWGIQFASLLFRGLLPIFRVYTMISTPVILSIIFYLIHKATKE
jgi:hypothetical protein